MTIRATLLRAMLVTSLLVTSLALSGCVSGRVSPVELEQLREALRLEPGMRLADVGAGDGRWSEALAHEVGPAGHVYATEVDPDDVDRIRERLEAAGLENFTAILGDQETTGLPENCCDAILLRLVYHHFTEPPKMRASLRSGLRDGALLVAVDILPQRWWKPLEGVPERDGHGITMEDLIDEMTGDGFEVVTRFEHWEGDDDHFCVVFRESRDAQGP